MLFITIEFIVFFMIVLATVVIIKHRKFQHLFLLFASYFFFYYTSNYLIILLIFTTIWDFYFGLAIYKADTFKKKKILLISSLAGNIGLLGYFKYADFTITQINVLGNFINFNDIPLLDMVLPIGISFYTFHSITYTVGIYRGVIIPVRLREYALFVAFFPQLVAGPILRAHEFLPQLREKMKKSSDIIIRQIVIENQNLKIGITIMAFGFLKKMFFADNIAHMVNDIFANPAGLDSLLIIVGAIGFGIQIYCDFSGYTDIAIGAALILGFKLPVNFNKPYFATSPSDFWRRWHISLSSWLRDYLYIPLGGNKKSTIRTYGNLFIVMLIGGLWHGASVNFIIWGALHGAYLAIHKMLQNSFPKISQNSIFQTRFGKITSIIITQYFVFLAWIAFRVKDTDMMLYSMKKFILIDFDTSNLFQFVSSNKISIFILILFIILHFISFNKRNIIEKISMLDLKIWVVLLTLISVSIVLFYNGNPEDFIYFKF